MISYKIELKLNSAGFSADDLGTVLPDFITERKTLVGLTWYPSAQGPASYTLIITILWVVSAVPKVFIEELAKDLYKWSKQKLLNLFRKKKCPIGLIRFVFNDVVVEYYCDNADTLLTLFKKLPKILSKIDIEKGTEWDIHITNCLISVQNKKKS